MIQNLVLYFFQYHYINEVLFCNCVITVIPTQPVFLSVIIISILNHGNKFLKSFNFNLNEKDDISAYDNSPGCRSACRWMTRCNPNRRTKAVDRCRTSIWFVVRRHNRRCTESTHPTRSMLRLLLNSQNIPSSSSP